MISQWEMLLRIAAAAALGGLIGLERDIHRRQAGFRTHLIVAMASATFMVVSAHFVWFQHYVAGQLVEVDTSRIAAAVVTGVGFLGGGSILRTGATVQGLTTAAALWLVAAIGLSCGAGMYYVGAFVTALGLLSLTALRRFEDKHLVRRKVTLLLAAVANPIDVVVTELRTHGTRILDVTEYRNDLVSERATVSFDLLIPEGLGAHGLISRLERMDGVREVSVGAPNT